MHRQYQTDYPYFITTNTKFSNRGGLFEEISIAIVLADVLRSLEVLFEFDLIGFVIMPNHMHILIKTNANGKNISQIMQKYKSLIYHRLSSDYCIHEKFWQKSYHANIKDSRELFITALEYLKQNPIRWSLPAHYLQYPYLYLNNEKIKKYSKLFSH